MSIQSTEKDYLASIRVAHAIHAQGELWYAMTQLAELYIKREWTQEASDILAFVLLQADVSPATYEQAYELFDDLERSICPRVIWDAKAFAQEMDLEGMMDYLLADDSATVA